MDLSDIGGHLLLLAGAADSMSACRARQRETSYSP